MAEPALNADRHSAPSCLQNSGTCQPALWPRAELTLLGLVLRLRELFFLLLTLHATLLVSLSGLSLLFALHSLRFPHFAWPVCFCLDKQSRKSNRTIRLHSVKNEGAASDTDAPILRATERTCRVCTARRQSRRYATRKFCTIRPNLPPRRSRAQTCRRVRGY